MKNNISYGKIVVILQKSMVYIHFWLILAHVRNLQIILVRLCKTTSMISLTTKCRFSLNPILFLCFLALFTSRGTGFTISITFFHEEIIKFLLRQSRVFNGKSFKGVYFVFNQLLQVKNRQGQSKPNTG